MCVMLKGLLKADNFLGSWWRAKQRVNVAFKFHQVVRNTAPDR